MLVLNDVMNDDMKYLTQSRNMYLKHVLELHYL